jgi:hypothetical protein
VAPPLYRFLKAVDEQMSNLPRPDFVFSFLSMPTVTVQTGLGDGSSGITYVVQLRDGRWTVSGVRGGWIT